MRFLVVDDEPDLRMILEISLRRWGHEVDVVADAEEAYDAIRARPPEAMLLDISLPGETGIDLLQRLRRDGMLPPRIALLSAMMPADLAALDGLDGVRQLAKPFGLAQLQALITEMTDPGVG